MSGSFGRNRIAAEILRRHGERLPLSRRAGELLAGEGARLIGDRDAALPHLRAQLVELVAELLVLAGELPDALLQLLDIEPHLPDFLTRLRRRRGGKPEARQEERRPRASWVVGSGRSRPYTAQQFGQTATSSALANEYPQWGRAIRPDPPLRKLRGGVRLYEPAPESTVTARRFCDQQEMSLHTATGRSLP